VYRWKIVLTAWIILACLVPGNSRLPEVLAAKHSGQVSTEIVGGEHVPQGKYPFVGILLDKKRGGSQKHKADCGVTLIGKRVAITAQHCVPTKGASKRLRVLLEATKLDAHQGVNCKVTVIQKADFVDLALLRLRCPHGTDLQPIRMLTPEKSGLLAPGTLLTIAGIGDTNPHVKGKRTGYDYPRTLREVKVPVIPIGECLRDYHGHLDPTDLCTAAKGKGACYGDSGSGYFTVYRGEDVLAAVESAGGGCADVTRPNIATDLSDSQVAKFIGTILANWRHQRGG
jgi:secreted trypsin-like serine protease